LIKKGTLRRHHKGIISRACQRLRKKRREGEVGAKFLSNAILDQSPAQIDVVGKRLTGTPLSKPLLGDEFRKPAKTERRNINRVALASRRSFQEITPAPGTAMLDKRIAGLDFYHPAFDPVVAAPRVVIHRKTKLQRQKSFYGYMIVVTSNMLPRATL
jgi:hypothetical protein